MVKFFYFLPNLFKVYFSLKFCLLDLKFTLFIDIFYCVFCKVSTPKTISGLKTKSLRIIAEIKLLKKQKFY